MYFTHKRLSIILYQCVLQMINICYQDEHDWQWTAPEVIADENALSTKSDVWSFGVLLYEVITFGEMPYKGMEKEKTLRGLSEGLRIPIPKGGLIHCPVEFYMTMLQCWHKNPERRLTFDFLCDLLFSFRNAVESEPYFKDDTHKFKYMTGTLQNEQGRTKESNESVQQTTVHDQSVVMYELWTFSMIFRVFVSKFRKRADTSKAIEPKLHQWKIADTVCFSMSMFMNDNEKCSISHESGVGLGQYSILNTCDIGVIDSEGPEK